MSIGHRDGTRTTWEQCGAGTRMVEYKGMMLNRIPYRCDDCQNNDLGTCDLGWDGDCRPDMWEPRPRPEYLRDGHGISEDAWEYGDWKGHMMREEGRY